MPDLVTHICIGYLAHRGIKRMAQTGTLFYLGIILPDALTRPANILLPRLYWLVMPLHTPLTLILVCLLISYLFSEELRRAAFLSLILGAYLHLFLDLFQKSIGPAYAWLFPFSWQSFQIGLFWAENSLVLLPLWVFLGGYLIARGIWKTREKVPDGSKDYS